MSKNVINQTKPVNTTSIPSFRSYLEANGLPPYTPVSNDNRNSAYGIIVEILGWVMVFSVIFLLGIALNWYLYTRHERVDRIVPVDFNESVKEEEVIELNSIDQKAIEQYQIPPIVTFEIEGVNYYQRLDEVNEILERAEAMYFECFDKNTDQRIQFDLRGKVQQLIKLRAFEQQAITFEQLSAFFQSILTRESNLGAKLLENEVSLRIKKAIEKSNRMRVEVLVLQEYHVDFKISNLKAKKTEVKQKKKKVIRRRADLPQHEKLYVSYLVQIRSMLDQSSESFHKLKILDTEDQMRITAQYNMNKYFSYLLQKYIKVFKEGRPSLLETFDFLRKKFKIWPQQMKYHSLETPCPDELEPEYNQVPIISCLMDIGEEEVDGLRNELLRINRLFRLMELIERRFKTKIIQVTDDFAATGEDDLKIQILREQAFSSFQAYCNTELKTQNNPDITGKPTEFIQGSQQMSRLEQIMMQKQLDTGGNKLLGPMMQQFLEEKPNESDLMKLNRSRQSNQMLFPSNQVVFPTVNKQNSSQQVMGSPKQSNVFNKELLGGNRYDYDKQKEGNGRPERMSEVVPRYEFPHNLIPHSGENFSNLARKFNNLGDPDAPRLLRSNIPNSMMMSNAPRFQTSMPHSQMQYQMLMQPGQVRQNPPLVRPVLLSQVMDEAVQYKLEFEPNTDGQQYNF